MSTTHSTPSHSTPSIRSTTDSLLTPSERAERLHDAQQALMGRLWEARTADIARLDVVAGRFILTGDLDFHGPGSDRRARLDEWVAAGAEWYLDCRIESDDIAFIAEHAPHIRYIHAPTDDDGLPKDEWFDVVLTGLGDALHDDSIGVITCHLGAHRAPSALLRILLELGWHELDALAEIAEARPVAQVLYATDAFQHFALGALWGDIPSDPRR
ncbi:MAG: hypothetical protein ACKO72_08950 [Actinomycetes bacterium]